MKDGLKAACLKEMFYDDCDYDWEGDSYAITLTGDSDENVFLRITRHGYDQPSVNQTLNIDNPNELLSALNTAAKILNLDYNLAEKFIGHHCPHHVMERFSKP
ncbi:hypothetical protein [Oleidesulfovibrio alaskensis]|uniref:hypothetical protein n=1 Tax=Oleidesulfovibrio alaskensis TaxID=58180 RepID=UPI0004868CB4|nr:hypothetical protein [Oleidesulfovibrio alaskensis]